MRRIIALVQSCNCARHVIHGNDIHLVRCAEGKRRKTGEKDECANHIELVCFRPAAIAENDARAENSARHIGQQLADHVLAEFLGSRVGIVIRAIPIDGFVFLHDLVRAVTGHGDRADVAETAQSVIVAGARSELDHFERAAEVHVQAAFFGFAIQGRGAMNHRIGGADEFAVIVVSEPEMLGGEIAQKNMDARVH